MTAHGVTFQGSPRARLASSLLHSGMVISAAPNPATVCGECDDLGRVAKVDADDRSRCSQSALSGIAAKRRTASFGKRG